MGSVVIIFLPILVPFILILGIAEKLGYNPNDVLLAPFELALNGIIEVFFNGSKESFFGFLDVWYDKFFSFLTENEDTLASASKEIADLLSKIL